MTAITLNGGRRHTLQRAYLLNACLLSACTLIWMALAMPVWAGADDWQSCAGQMRPTEKLALAHGNSHVYQVPGGHAIVGRTLGNPQVLEARLLAPDTVYLLATDVGSTNMLLQLANQQCLNIDVAVGMDAKGLQQSLASIFPNETGVQVSAAADTLVLSGTVQDSITASRIVDLAEAFVRRQVRAVSSGYDESRDPNVADPASGDKNNPMLNQRQPIVRGTRVINLLNVAAPQQVMLEVKIAEVSKSLLDRLGVDLAISNNSGAVAYALLSKFTSGLLGGAIGASRGPDRRVIIEAEKRDGLVKVLAEPNLLAISGQEGSFLAGGRFFIPVGQNNNNGTTTITLEEKEFGVGLKFIPTVLSDGRINIKVSPEVSELSREGIGITAAGLNATSILPLITTRRASTTVQLYDGQSFAIGGLIRNNTTTNIRALPILGEIPILGALFRSTSFQEDKTELLFVITPRLVEATREEIALPTEGVNAPGRAELFLNGKIEGARSPLSSSQPVPRQPVPGQTSTVVPAEAQPVEEAPASPTAAPASPAAAPPGSPLPSHTVEPGSAGDSTSAPANPRVNPPGSTGEAS